MNPFFNAMGGQQMAGPMGNMQQVIQAFQQFKNNFKGDPRQEVQKMLQSGRISQQQLDQAQTMARQMEQVLR